MAAARQIGWERCTVKGCAGSRLGENGKCLAHLGPGDLERALEQIAEGGDLDGRGVSISSELLLRIFDALPRTSDGRPRFPGTNFEGATFEQDATFGEAIFEGDAWFADATFGADAWFGGTVFHGNAQFSEAIFKEGASFGGVFEGDAWFGQSSFEARSDFGGATFKRTVSFAEATFRADAMFSAARFEGDVVFGDATFDGWVGFEESTFRGDAWFGSVTFANGIQFANATFSGDALFVEASFQRERRFGPTLVLGTLSFEEATFFESALLRVSANRLDLSRAQFPEGGQIQARWAEIALDDADFGAPSLLTGSVRFAEGFKERSLVKRIEREARRSVRSGRPRVASLRRANVGKLALSNVDLRACRFVGAHSLDQLRIDPRSVFAAAPAEARVTRRQTIAEEQEWRAGRSGRWWRSNGWYPAACEFAESLGTTDPLQPAEIAPIYRELRKGLEESKNEPGAADFYYGEMEMRRYDKSAPLAERLIIWFYWLVSGYGLRGSRALISLVVTVLVFAALLDAWGFQTREHFARALTFSAESTTSLFRAPPRPKLTLTGEWLQIGLRLLGPLFFGLALLSLRGRVKR